MEAHEVRLYLKFRDTTEQQRADVRGALGPELRPHMKLVDEDGRAFVKYVVQVDRQPFPAEWEFVQDALGRVRNRLGLADHQVQFVEDPDK